MTNGEYLRQDNENLAWFINLVTFYCSSRFVEHKSCSEVCCPLAREGYMSCHPDSIMEWLKIDHEHYCSIEMTDAKSFVSETEPSCFNCRWCNTYTKWCCLTNESIDGRANPCEKMWECDPYEKEE